MIGQAQSGTGKTCVFGVVAVEAVTPSQPGLQALLLAPTREIALQTLAVIREIGADEWPFFAQLVELTFSS